MEESEQVNGDWAAARSVPADSPPRSDGTPTAGCCECLMKINKQFLLRVSEKKQQPGSWVLCWDCHLLATVHQRNTELG